MDGINTIPSAARHAHSHTSGQEVETQAARPRHHAAAGPSSGASATGEPHSQESIDKMVTQLSHYFPGSSGMNELVQSRARELLDMGESSEKLAETMAKGQKLDYISEAVGGAVKAFPFSISGYPAGAIKLGADISGGSMKSEGAGAATDGATAMVLKSIGDKVFAPVVKDSLWLAADAEKLEPEMQGVLKKRQGLGESLRLAPLGSQGFNGRNAVVGTVATLTHNNPQATSHTSNILSLSAGSAGGVLTNKFSASHGPEYLLGRTDWKEKYQLLKDTSIKQQMSSGGAERLKTLLVSLATPRNYAKGVLNVVSGNMLAEIGALALGLGLNAAVRYAARNTGAGEAVSSASSAAIDELTNRLGAGDLTNMKDIAADQAINLIGAGLAYAFQGVAGALAGPAQSRNDEAVDFLADKVVNSVLGQKTGEMRDKGLEALQSGASHVGQFAVDSVDYGKTKIVAGANALADGAVKTGNAFSDGLSSAKSNVSDAMNGAQQWASEQLRQRFTSPQQPVAMAGQTISPTAPAATTSQAQPAPDTSTSQATAPAATTTQAQPAAETSTSRATAPAATTSPAQPAPDTQPTAQASTSRATAPQPAPSRSTAQTAQIDAPVSTSEPAAEQIEMQPMGKSKQA